MSFLRFFMWLSLVVWIGGIIFFAFVVAPTVFRVLPTHQLAGNVVNRSLSLLHGIGDHLWYHVRCHLDDQSAVVSGSPQPFASRHILVYLMIASDLGQHVRRRRANGSVKGQMVTIDEVPQDDARRVEFNRLHVWTTRLEGTVLLLGLVLVFLTARRLT